MSFLVINRRQVQPGNDGVIAAQVIGDPKAGRKKAGIHHLMDLGSNLPGALQHVF
jgi:hypothetical protein